MALRLRRRTGRYGRRRYNRRRSSYSKRRYSLTSGGRYSKRARRIGNSKFYRNSSRIYPSKNSLLTAGRGYIPGALVERKFIDITPTSFSLLDFNGGPVNGTMWLLNGCSQGTSVHQRAGVKTTYRELQFNIHMEAPGVTYLPPCFRYLIILDRSPPAAIDATAFANDIFHTPTDYYSPIKPSMQRRITVLYDSRTVPLHPYGVGGSSGIVTVPLKFSTMYKTGGATIADVESNALYLFAFVSTTLTGAAPGILFSSRAIYTDA